MSERSHDDAKAATRSAALWAAVAAVLLLYFGYRTGFLWGTAAERVGGIILSNTLKYGGWAMAATAVWLFTGMRAALLADAVACAAIGLGLLSGGLLFLPPSLDLVGVLYPVVGLVFLGSARNSWREHRVLGGPAGEGAAVRPGAAPTQRQESAPPVDYGTPSGSLTSRLIEQRRGRQVMSSATTEPSPPAAERGAASGRAPASAAVPAPASSPPTPAGPVVSPPPVADTPLAPAVPPPGEDEESPEGFLARFAPPSERPSEGA